MSAGSVLRASVRLLFDTMPAIVKSDPNIDNRPR